ncbi:CDP-alcohol phosphatidyltransferase family protein [Glaciibacter superstes]|uniref:CDP-alcohol phosphatidyltransferase family protein n=1 Tax=Glaciibacter superstes TaxID=501023 RepID=UPI0003B5F242|nr:CDP-alcohol phosphatidyltransferase family protein [Glaciibacter superstes]
MSRAESTRLRRPRTRSADGYALTVRRLASAQKSAAPGAPPYSIYVNRRVGRYLAAWAYRRGFSPNGVTAISAAFTFIGVALIALVPPQWWLGVVVWLALAIGYAFDSADGQVARLRGGGSAAGEWLDHIVDCIKIATLHGVVLVAAYRFFDLPNAAWLLVPIAYGVVASVSFFAMILNDQLKANRRQAASAAHSPVPTRAHRGALKSVLLLPTDYGILCAVFLLLGFPPVFFVIYTLMAVANTGHLTLALAKWFTDMRVLDDRNLNSQKRKAS